MWPERFLRDPHIDAVAVSEGEVTFADLLGAIEKAGGAGKTVHAVVGVPAEAMRAYVRDGRAGAVVAPGALVVGAGLAGGSKPSRMLRRGGESMRPR